MNTLTIYYFTLLADIYWMMLTEMYAMKVNSYQSVWFYSFLVFHFCFFMKWYFDSFSWHIDNPRKKYINGKAIEIKDEEYTFNPFFGKITIFNNSTLKSAVTADNVRNDIIENNISVSMNLLTLVNFLFGIAYTINLFMLSELGHTYRDNIENTYYY